MTALLLTVLLYQPLAPINPIEQDTLPAWALHFEAGMVGPNGVVTTGPEVSAMLEMLVVHPFMVRGTADARYGQVTSGLFPNGNLYTLSLGADAIYYRGTNHLTGYFGVGAFYTVHSFDPFERTADSLRANEGWTAVDIQPKFGYRLILGLRFSRIYSMEISVDDLHPDFKMTGTQGDGVESRSYKTTRTGAFRLTFGYVVPL